MEGRISEMEDQITPLTRDTRTALQQAPQAKPKQIRQNNVHIVGLPKKVEGRDPTAFKEQWLQDIFVREAFSSLFAV